MCVLPDCLTVILHRTYHYNGYIRLTKLMNLGHSQIWQCDVSIY